MSKIKGYRQLSDTEIANINAVKAHGEKLDELISSMQSTGDMDQRWVQIGKTHIQQGLMALTRAIAKPEGL